MVGIIAPSTSTIICKLNISNFSKRVGSHYTLQTARRAYRWYCRLPIVLIQETPLCCWLSVFTRVLLKSTCCLLTKKLQTMWLN